jgi:2-keto-4-pentenoate hydratase
MNHAHRNEAAAQLAGLRLRRAGFNNPIAELPEHCRPQTLNDAYAVQASVAELLAQGPLGRPSGWKIGCTTTVMQDYLNIAHPCAGRLYTNRTYLKRASLQATNFFTLGLECEIAVHLSEDLDVTEQRHTAQSVLRAVDGVCASIEVVEHRFEDFSAASTESLVADDFFSVGCIHGELVEVDSVGDLGALRGGFSFDGRAPEVHGIGSAILGDPMSALAWLARHCNEVGEPLRAGELVTLGSVVKTVYPNPGDTIEARFAGLPPATAIIR